MRRREKFVLTSIVLALALFGVLITPAIFRVWTIFALGMLTFLLVSWALSEDLQKIEMLTVVPLPVLYAVSISGFYFVLPSSTLKQIVFLILFALGMYALLLTCNIFSVAKGRTIQLVYAAQTVGLFFTLLTSFLFTNTLFTLNLPFIVPALLLSLLHIPLIINAIWSINLGKKLEVVEWTLVGLMSLAIFELAIAISFIPYPVWAYGLCIMSLLYVGLGVFQSYLKGRLFTKTVREYSLVTIFSLLLFILLFPGK